MLKKTIQKIDRAFTIFEDWSLFLSVCIALTVAMANVLLRKLTSDVNLYWSDEVVRKTIYFFDLCRLHRRDSWPFIDSH